MKKILVNIIISLLIFAPVCLAHVGEPPSKPTFKQQREFDKMLDNRLKLTQEQKEQLKANRIKHFKEMDKIVSRMQVLHDKIRNVYLTGIPPFQADLKTAPYKAELVLLKQNVDKLKQEHRKSFENILTQEQKLEFEKIKKELALKRKPPQNN